MQKGIKSNIPVLQTIQTNPPSDETIVNWLECSGCSCWVHRHCLLAIYDKQETHTCKACRRGYFVDTYESGEESEEEGSEESREDEERTVEEDSSDVSCVRSPVVTKRHRLMTSDEDSDEDSN